MPLFEESRSPTTQVNVGHPQDIQYMDLLDTGSEG